MDALKSSAYSEVSKFLVSSPTPEEILAFRPSEATQERAILITLGQYPNP
jgi:hypothetical protein